MNRQLTDYRTLQHLLLEQQQKQLQYAPTLVSPIIPKVEVSSPLTIPHQHHQHQKQQISTATSSISNSPFVSIESPQIHPINVGSGPLMDLRKSLQQQVDKSRRQSFPLKEHSSSSLFDGECEGESLTTADDAIITEKTRMLIVSAATLTKLYGTKHHRHSAANSPIVEGNIRKGDLKCVVCQDKAVSKIYPLFLDFALSLI
uniref:Uncharacterized protein n=1 Tax=Panagrolaimus sp. ES5 TaxID=591445 RepID=A0AC34FLH4_9BILA